MTVTIGRRELLAALSGAAVAVPLAARAQQAKRVRRIGLLCARRERPRCRRAAEYSQQFPPSDGDCHAPPVRGA